MPKTKFLFIFVQTVLFLSACTSSRYVSIAPEMEMAFKGLHYNEIVSLLGRKPNSIILQDDGGQSLVYYNLGNNGYLNSFDENGRVSGGKKKYLKLVLDKDNICYGVYTNLTRKIVKFDKDGLEEGIIHSAAYFGSILLQSIR